MDYLKIHDKFIEYFKEVNPRNRMIKRNSEDVRLEDRKLYLERHHILPSSQGGSNEEDNIVLLLPEEHIFIHFLRYKAINHRNDMLAFRFCINGMKSKVKNDKLDRALESKMLNKHVRSMSAMLKHYSSSFRKTHGWHTLDGVRRIAQSRKGKIPVVDSVTRESKGVVTSNHPNYMSGEWVHHSKGISLSEEHKKKIVCKGESNGRYCDITDTQIIDYAIEFYSIFKVSPAYKKLIEYVHIMHDKNIPKSLSKFRFNGKSFKGYNDELESVIGERSNPYDFLRRVKLTKEFIKKYKKDLK